jgi:hypothetical protein
VKLTVAVWSQLTLLICQIPIAAAMATTVVASDRAGVAD